MILKNKRATSIVEAVIVTMIMTIWIVWMFKVYTQSVKLAIATENRITAIQIAREWLEAMESLRWSNWIMYSSDYTNCWNVLNYNWTCINNPWTWTDIQHNTSYIIQNDTSNRWVLDSKPSSGSDYELPLYRTNFAVRKDANGFYTQSWWTDFNPIFTREIKIEYLDTNWIPIDSDDEKMLVTSLVQWSDYASSKPHKVELETILSNWEE